LSNDEPKEPFGHWLRAQSYRDDELGDLAKDLAQDRWFPIEGGPAAVRARLADLNINAARLVREAEAEWAATPIGSVSV
jgi:hypothetical protein